MNRFPVPQQGAILAFALGLLLILTLVGMIVIRSTLLANQTLQQQLQRHYQLENAEIALHEAEDRLRLGGGAQGRSPIRGAYNDSLPRPSYRIDRIPASERCPGSFFRIIAEADTTGSGEPLYLQSLFRYDETGICRSGRIGWAEIQLSP